MNLNAAKENTANLGAIKKTVSTINDKPTAKPQVLLKSNKSVTTGWLQNRRPPAQPKLAVKQSPASDDEDDTSEGAPPIAAPMLDRKPLTAKKRTLLSGQKRKLTTASASASAADPLPSPLAGAIGALVLPPSLRTAMRPHQLSGVAYLWNCLTGESPNLRRIAEQAGVDRTPRGAILADSMGMGTFCLFMSIE